jgi:RNA polymerase sigma-70 factor (ECF subfamily)
VGPGTWAAPAIGAALRHSAERPDAYVVQAAVAACHALAPSYASTSWDAAISWYDVPIAVADTPVVRLNRAAPAAQSAEPPATS